MHNLTRKSLFTFLLIAVFAVFVSAQSRNIEDFNGVSTSGNLDVTLQKADETRVDIKMIKGNIEDVITEIDDGILEVRIDNKSWFGNKNKTKAKITIFYTELNNVKTSAASSLMATEPLSMDHLVVKASSGSSIRLETKTKSIDVRSSSGASIRLSGNTTNSSFKSSSGSNINASDLVSDISTADVSSGASVSCHAGKELEAEASSGGSVKYTGDPNVKDVQKSSGGRVYPQS